VVGTALALWGATMLVGAYMFMVAAGMSRPAGESAHSHWPSWLMFVHASAALGGAGLLVAYLVTKTHVLTWISFVDLLLVAGLGDWLFVSWFKARRAVAAAERGEPVKRVRDYVPLNVPPTEPGQRMQQVEVDQDVAVTDLQEMRIPTIAVLAHGGLAVLTIVTVLLAALGVGT
jgi:hypothetical protein